VGVVNQKHNNNIVKWKYIKHNIGEGSYDCHYCWAGRESVFCRVMSNEGCTGEHSI